MASRSATRRTAFALPLLLAAGLLRWDPVAHRLVEPHPRGVRKAARAK
jgi:hypothetical protein